MPTLLQESLIRFSKFLQENDAKRARAERKAQEENKLAKAKAREIASLQETLEALKDEKEQTLEVLDKNLQYQQYLEHVLEVHLNAFHASSQPRFTSAGPRAPCPLPSIFTPLLDIWPHPLLSPSWYGSWWLRTPLQVSSSTQP